LSYDYNIVNCTSIGFLDYYKKEEETGRATGAGARTLVYLLHVLSLEKHSVKRTGTNYNR
jgi:hypothetical protein